WPIDTWTCTDRFLAEEVGLGVQHTAGCEEARTAPARAQITLIFAPKNHPDCCAPGLTQTSASRVLASTSVVKVFGRALSARQRGDCRPKTCRSYDRQRPRIRSFVLR